MRKLLPALLVAAAIGLVPSAVSAAVVQNVWVPINAAFPNICGTGTVTVSGSIHFIASLTPSTNGGFHVHEDDNVAGITGVDSNGVNYVGTGGDWFEANTGPVFPVVLTQTDVIGLISQGPAPNIVLKAVQHLTVNANGTVTSNIVNLSASCRG